MINTLPSTFPVLYKLEAEEALAGSVLIDPEIYPILAIKIKPSDFYIERLRWIWEAFGHIHDGGSKIDFITLCAELERKFQLGEIGGSAFLTSLLTQVPSSLNAEHYAEIVSNFADLRKLLNVCNSTATKIFEGRQTASEIIAQVEQDLHGTDRVNGGVLSFKDALSEYYDLTEAISNGKIQPRVVPTGIFEIDKLMAGGMRGGDLILLGGRPGQGKSATLLTIAYNNLKQGRSVLLFSPEMSHEQITSRLLVLHTSLDSQTIRQHKLNDDQWPIFIHAVDELENYHLFLDDLQSISPQQMRARAIELQAHQPIDLVIVDYIQLMISERAKENRVQEVSYLSRCLKLLARELDVPVLAASQLSRAVEARDEKRPKLSDLRESGSLEQDADAVMFVWNPDENAKGDILNYGLSLAKQRNGPIGDAQVLFNKPKAMLVNRAS